MVVKGFTLTTGAKQGNRKSCNYKYITKKTTSFKGFMWKYRVHGSYLALTTASDTHQASCAATLDKRVHSDGFCSRGPNVATGRPDLNGAATLKGFSLTGGDLRPRAPATGKWEEEGGGGGSDGGEASGGSEAAGRPRSLLLIAAVPRQLPLVEVDDHLGVAGAGFAGRQQRHVLGVLPAGRSNREGATVSTANICRGNAREVKERRRRSSGVKSKIRAHRTTERNGSVCLET